MASRAKVTNKNAHGRLKHPDPSFKFYEPGSFRWWIQRSGLVAAIKTKLTFPIYAKTGKKWNDFWYKHTTLRRLEKRDQKLAQEEYDKVQNLNPLTGKQQDHPWGWKEIERDAEGHTVDVIKSAEVFPRVVPKGDPLFGPWGA